MFVAYNFRRIINMLGKKELKKYLKTFGCSFLSISGLIKAVLSRFQKSVSLRCFYPSFLEHPANQLIFTKKLTGMTGF